MKLALLAILICGCSLERIDIPLPVPVPVPVVPVPDVPTPEPSPSPEPEIVVAPNLRILVVEDKRQRDNLPESQKQITKSTEIRRYILAKCQKERWGYPAFRLFDHEDDPKRDHDYWRKMFSRPRTSLPWVVISNDKSTLSGPLPLTVEETLRILKQFGG